VTIQRATREEIPTLPTGWGWRIVILPLVPAEEIHVNGMVFRLTGRLALVDEQGREVKRA